MNVLLDTNILLRLVQVNHPIYKPATDSVALLRGVGETLCLVPQNLYEYWVVCTRPNSENGLGFTVPETETEFARIKKFFPVFEDSATILPQWEKLVVNYQVSGKNAHDARLVAAMIVHGISRILTFNTADFQRYKEIEALSPDDVGKPLP